jgi:hypothetical protein
MPRASSNKPLFDLHPSVAMAQKWVADLPAKTGRSLEQWIDFIKRKKCPDEKAAREWLKADLKLGTNTAWWLAQNAFASDLSLVDHDPHRYLALAPEYVERQYGGRKAHLRPIFDALAKLARSIAPDVKVCPCETVVSIYREHLIANIKPSTQSRVDLGLWLVRHVRNSKAKLPARLIDTGGLKKKDRITHRIAIESTDDIDEFVEKWLRRAHALDVE